MTTDEVKKYLRQAEKLDKRLKRERRNLEKLMSAAEYRSPAFEGVGGDYYIDKLSDFCPNCGARMDGDSDDQTDR